jgi:hypothetical protein
LVAAVVATGLVAVAVGAPVGSARAENSFTPGQGIASGYVLHLSGLYNGADLLGLNIGEAGGQYQDTSAQGSSATVDFGLADIVTSATVCGVHTPNPLPPAVVADTDQSNGQPVSKSTSGGAGLAGGAESASAAPNSDGRGDGSGLSFDFPGLVRVSGGAVHTEARMDPVHEVRTVTSEVDVARVILLSGLPGGGIELGGLRWFLQTVVSGPDNRSETRSVTSSFTMSSAKVLGLSLPVTKPDQAQRLLVTVNSLAAPLGVQLRLPKVVPYGLAGLEYTPLTVAIGGKTLYGPIAAPLLGGATITKIEKALRPGIFDATNCNELFGALKPIPSLNAAWNGVGIVAPIAISVVAVALDGQGELDLNIGDVTNNVDDTYYPAPSSRSANHGGGPGTAGPGGGASGGGGGATGGSGATGGAGGLAMAGAASPPSLASSPSGKTTWANVGGGGRARCETTSPVGWPGCWKGQGRAAAGALGLLTLGLLVADEVYRRRRLAATEAEEAG